MIIEVNQISRLICLDLMIKYTLQNVVGCQVLQLQYGCCLVAACTVHVGLS